MRTMEEIQNGKDILTTAIEGGIGYWAQAGKALRDDDGSWVCAVLWPAYDPDFDARPICYSDVLDAIDSIVAGNHEMNGTIQKTIATRDPGAIDAECADVIVQIAMFGEITYG